MNSTTNADTPANVRAAARFLLSDPEGAALYGVGLRTFMELQHESWFPKPVMLGPRLKRHVRAELEAAAVNLARRDKPAEPKQLLRARIERMKQSGAAS